MSNSIIAAQSIQALLDLENQDDVNAQCPILQLPSEMIQKILFILPLPEIRNVALTCKRLQDEARETIVRQVKKIGYVGSSLADAKMHLNYFIDVITNTENPEQYLVHNDNGNIDHIATIKKIGCLDDNQRTALVDHFSDQLLGMDRSGFSCETDKAQVLVSALIGFGVDPNTKNDHGETLLYRALCVLDAARPNSITIIKLLLDKGANANARCSDNCTPLHIAAENGSEAVAQLLLENGAVANARCRNNYTPLHMAALKGSKAVARLLLEKGADANARCSDNCTPLHIAAENGSEAVAQLLLENGADANARYWNKNTPLHIAALKGSEAVARLLLGNGADANAGGRNNKTPLHIAAENGSKAVARLLLENGADVNAKCCGNETPLQIALSGRSEDPKDDDIHLCIEGYYEDDTYQHIEDYEDNTPLPIGVGSEAVALLLLEKGADMNARYWDNETLLHKALRGRSEVVARLLLEKGADVNAKCSDNETPLHIAAGNGSGAVVRLLLEKGADANARCRNNYTPLHIAAENGSEAVARLLLEKGADANARCSDDETPLHRVLTILANDEDSDEDSIDFHMDAENGSGAVARLLLENGADVNVKNNYGYTPLTIATNCNMQSLLDLMKKCAEQPLKRKRDADGQVGIGNKRISDFFK